MSVTFINITQKLYCPKIFRNLEIIDIKQRDKHLSQYYPHLNKYYRIYIARILIQPLVINQNTFF